MGLTPKSVQKFSTPSRPAPLPLASEVDETVTNCPACSVAIRPGAVLCINCGARIGRIDSVAPSGFATRAPCPNCDYDMSGMSGTTCPECGGVAPFAPPKLDFLTEQEEWTSRQVFWEACRNGVWVGALGLAILFALAGGWYGADGMKFWLAAIVPTWVVASVGFIVCGLILRFLDTSLPITLFHVLAVVLVGLAVTELVFPVTGGRIWFSLKTMLLVPIVVTGATVLVMDDDDKVQCFLASLPISLACLVVPLVLFAILA
ncbi:MAG: zinc ribbon domain-containing protein [Phycisphaeraceae bacterium]|nr:zinc ribbon domain-containing protein [Phycisphaeraceae bacterium]